MSGSRSSRSKCLLEDKMGGCNFPKNGRRAHLKQCICMDLGGLGWTWVDLGGCRAPLLMNLQSGLVDGCCSGGTADIHQRD
eukprot:1159589-Pelagomonas_calceolata.AAC.10